jgi:hypothetical protein
MLKYPIEVVLLAITHRQMTGYIATYVRDGREDHQELSNWFGDILEYLY